MTLTLFDCIQDGPDWLDSPDFIRFTRDEGLDDVRIQLVGPRRSFSGKTWPGFGVVRMVSVGVHPIRWLLTLIHELAHVADYRQRVRDMEKVWGRPYKPGRHDGRLIWRLERPHGERWRQEFIRLAKNSIAAGLFPGNERAVLAAAEEGATSLDDVALNLRADPRVDAEELCRYDEQLREGRARAALSAEEFRQIFSPGEVVHFDAGPRRGVMSGKLVRINRRSCTVEARGAKWHVPHGLLRLGEAAPDARPARRPVEPCERFSAGDRVYFRHEGARLEGGIIRVNRKTCTVETMQGKWRVAFSLLRPLQQK